MIARLLKGIIRTLIISKLEFYFRNFLTDKDTEFALCTNYWEESKREYIVGLTVKQIADIIVEDL